MVHRNGVGFSSTKADKGGSLTTWLRAHSELPMESHSRSRWPSTKARAVHPDCDVSNPIAGDTEEDSDKPSFS